MVDKKWVTPYLSLSLKERQEDLDETERYPSGVVETVSPLTAFPKTYWVYIDIEDNHTPRDYGVLKTLVEEGFQDILLDIWFYSMGEPCYDYLGYLVERIGWSNLIVKNDLCARVLRRNASDTHLPVISGIWLEPRTGHLVTYDVLSVEDQTDLLNKHRWLKEKVDNLKMNEDSD